MTQQMMLPISALRYSVKKRRGVSPRRVEEICQEIEAGRDIHPIRVNALGDGTYTVKDGRHRIQAHCLLKLFYVYAVVENILVRFFYDIFKKAGVTLAFSI
jgi:ParB-like chromosome segregation protein Spo0J